jgi:hypothetical protein
MSLRHPARASLYRAPTRPGMISWLIDSKLS